MIAGRTDNEILGMPSSTRCRWYKTISVEDKKSAMKIVDIAGRIKMSKIATNRIHSDETRIKMSKAKSGKNNPMYDKERTEEWRSNQSKFMKKLWEDPEFIAKRKEAMSDPEVLAKMSNSGEKNSNWQGGLSYEPYGKEFNDELKEQIRERDGYVCQECGMTQEESITKWGEVLSVHHIDYDKMNRDKRNLITLCRSCHTKTNFNREDWIEYFGGLLK